MWKLCVLVFVAGVALVGAFVALVREDQHAAPGVEIVYDDFGFSASTPRRAAEVGDGDARVAAAGQFVIVTLHVANHARVVEFDLGSWKPVLEDSNGRRWLADPAATHAQRVASSPRELPVRIAAHTSIDLPFVWDVPADAHGLVLRISWGGPLVDFLDRAVSGDREIVLDGG